MADKSKENASYYQRHKDRIVEQRRQRYKEDPDYRERLKAQARERSARLRAAGVKVKRKPKPRKDPEQSRAARAEAVHTRDMKIVVGGRELVVTMHTLGFLADRLGRSIQGLRLWEQNGILPEALYRDKSGRRLFTSFQLDRIVSIYRELFPGDKPKSHAPLAEFQVRLAQLWREMPQGVPVH